MTPEAKVKARVRKMLDEFGVYYFFPPANGYGRTGVPDIICCVQGRLLALECKAGNNKPTALQERELQRIRESGGEALVINEDNIKDAEMAVRILTCRG